MEDDHWHELRPFVSELEDGPYGGHSYGDPAYRPVPPDPASYGSSGSSWRRRQSIKRGVHREVKLTSGHFIAEYAVPTPVYNIIDAKWRSNNTTEFSHMRYTAATSDPDEFTVERGWSLRPAMYNRETELLICVTSYNEDKSLYAKTLYGLMANIRDICKTRTSRFWRRTAEEGIPGWQRIVVALLVDGLEPMDKGVLDILATIGVYQDGVMKRQVDGQDTVAHIFEYTTPVSVDDAPSLILPYADDDNSLVPVQIILVLKAKNQRKINSHRWLFNAFGRMLQPEICVLVDAGTAPGHKSIYYLWEAFYNDPYLGGCCGEVHPTIKAGRKLLNPLVAAQNFEYKMWNVLDKPMESNFGFISVLPGAFSAYRYRAILGRPLEQYFHGDHSLADRLGPRGIHGMNIFTKNMFLAEDRILCFELAAKMNDRWTLKYVRASKAETDVPETAAELMGQRRRWLNGSFAASVYGLANFFLFYKTDHGIIRKFFFHIQAIYNVCFLLFSWFALANIWISFSITVDLLPSQGISIFGTAEITYWVNLVFRWVYLAFLLLQFILALGNRRKAEQLTYTITLWVYAFFAVYLLVCSFWLMGKTFAKLPDELKNKTKGEVISMFLKPPEGALISFIVATFVMYFVASLLSRDPWHVFFSFFQYLCLVPSYTNVLSVYAFCNLHDISWGTKGKDKSEALPSVLFSHAQGEVTVKEVIEPQEDIDAAFRETVARAVTKITFKTPPEQPTLDDQNKTFRTRLVVLWVVSNAVLATVINYINGLPNQEDPLGYKSSLKTKRDIYFGVILYSTFGLDALRFIGCLFYFITRHLFRFCRSN